MLNLIDFLCGGKLPKMSCYGCLKEDCKNRSYYENKLCKGYKNRRTHNLSVFEIPEK